MRVLLIHVGKGYSLRETAVLAKASGLAEVSGTDQNIGIYLYKCKTPPPRADRLRETCNL